MKYEDLSMFQQEIVRAMVEQINAFDDESCLAFRPDDMVDIDFREDDAKTDPVMPEEHQPLALTFKVFIEYFKENFKQEEHFDALIKELDVNGKFKNRVMRKYNMARKNPPLRVLRLTCKLPDERYYVNISAYARKTFVDAQAQMLFDEYDLLKK